MVRSIECVVNRTRMTVAMDHALDLVTPMMASVELGKQERM